MPLRPSPTVDVHLTPSDLRAQLEHDVRVGLTASQKWIPATWFYDEEGCRLFDEITRLPEYYPTRTERAIFGEHRDAIADSVGRGKQFVDLGAGDCRKALAWLPLLAPARYLAVDFAGDEIAKSLATMAPEFPEIEMLGIVADFTDGLDLEADLDARPVTFFYPGSSIGNFDPEAALAFLRKMHRHCARRDGSGLLIGVDMKKDKDRLDAAYDDAVGVTAAFNRNVLHHVNRLLGSNFNPAAFVHRGFYNPSAGRVEMHLEAVTPQTVRWPGGARTFAAGERIHTENSYKYAPPEFREMLAAAGFADVACWQDTRGDFAVFYAS